MNLVIPELGREPEADGVTVDDELEADDEHDETTSLSLILSPNVSTPNLHKSASDKLLNIPMSTFSSRNRWHNAPRPRF